MGYFLLFSWRAKNSKEPDERAQIAWGQRRDPSVYSVFAYSPQQRPASTWPLGAVRSLLWTPEELRVLFHPEGLNPHPLSATGAVHSGIIGLQSRQIFLLTHQLKRLSEIVLLLKLSLPIVSCVLQVIWSL